MGPGEPTYRIVIRNLVGPISVSKCRSALLRDESRIPPATGSTQLLGEESLKSTLCGAPPYEARVDAVKVQSAWRHGCFYPHSYRFPLRRGARVSSKASPERYPSRRHMPFVSYIHVLSAAFLIGLAAAAPMGPVNMLAIRRGMIGGWRHTLACGIGSVTGDLILFSLVLLGGHYLFSDLSNPTLQTVLEAIGVIVLVPLGIYFLVRAVKEPLRAYASARQHWDESTVPAHLVAEVANAVPA